MEIEIASPGPYRCGEGPVWDADRGRLLFVDIEAARIHEHDPGSGETRVLAKGIAASGLALNGPGELVVAGAAGLHLWRAPGETVTLLEEDRGEPLVFNDCVAGPGGRLYAGTLHWGPEGMERTGKLYLIERDLTLRAVDEGIELANGLALSPDGRTLYFADSAARRIYAHDVHPDTGDLSRRRVLAQIPREEGIPDGLAVDAEGFIWCAQWYGAQVVRYDPQGQVERRIRLPVPQAASLAFGGPDLSDLYITTAADPWPSPLAPHGFDPAARSHGGGSAGGPVYRVRPGPRGFPERRADLRRPLAGEPARCENPTPEGP